MAERSTKIDLPLARWSSRIALFSASLLVVGVALHRLTSFPTPVAFNLFAVSAALGVLAVLVGLIALIVIWRRGRGGAGSAAFGILLPLIMMAWPLTYVPAFLRLPPINDVTTDWAQPPRFVTLAKQRAGDANPVAYPGERFATEQQKAYPDLRTFILDRSVEDTFDLVEDTVRKLRWKVAAAEAPVGRPAKGGTIEATDTSLVVGFTDDIVVRVEGSANRSRIDVRSASRFGSADLGQNAARVRRFLTELQARADATGAGSVAGRRALRTKRVGAMVKKGKERDQQKAESRTSRDRAQSSAQRARSQKELQR